jgi:nucleoside-diphosphate-sugar epimerase
MSEVALVTSSAGYIGSHVSKALAKSGVTPASYDTLVKGHPWAVRWRPLERGDIGDAARLEEVFARHKPRAIVHMAATSKSADRCASPNASCITTRQKAKSSSQLLCATALTPLSSPALMRSTVRRRPRK